MGCVHGGGEGEHGVLGLRKGHCWPGLELEGGRVSLQLFQNRL